MKLLFPSADLYIVIGVCVVAEFIFAIVIFSILKWNRNRRSRDHGRYAVLASESWLGNGELLMQGGSLLENWEESDEEWS